MLRPFLLVGVGGSGGKTLRIVRDDLLRRLRQAGWTKPDLPAAWQFLHIDVPTHADGNDIDLPPQLPDKQYRGMVASGVDYSALDRSLLSKGGDSIVDALATWRPDPNDVKVSPRTGAGQFRALGRTISMTGIEGIQRAIQNARREMTGTGVVAELQEVTRLLGGTPSTEAGEPTVVVVSSIAGGTGAGAVIDVCDVIRALPDKWADESFGFLYAPDVFNELPEEARRGVRANALGTLAELMNGYWNNTGPAQATSALFAAHGVTLSQTSRRSGPRFPFLVGASNEKVTYKSQNDIYRAMGRSIASWVASEKLQDSFTAYVGGNWSATNGRSGVTDRLAPTLRTDDSETPFTAIGSARVGLGRDRFQDYAAQHLARSAVERVVEEHEKSRHGITDDRTNKQIISDLEIAQRPGFRVATGLNELGPDNNDVLDALRANTSAAGNEYQGMVSKAIQELIAASKKNAASPNDAVQRVAGVVRDNEQRISASLREQTLHKARTWVNEIQDRVVDVVARRVTEAGAPVTHALLENLILAMSDIGAELAREADENERHAIAFDQLVREATTGYAKNAITAASDETVQKAARNAINATLARYEKDLRMLARDLLADLSKNFLEPLSRAVGDAGERLSVERSAEDSVVGRWPFGDSVPSRLQPAPNEFLLEETTQYPQILQDIVRRTVGVDADPDAARREAEQSVLLGTARRDDPGQSLIKITDRWVPTMHFLTPEVGMPPRRARFAVGVDPEAIERRAETWLRREGTAAGRYMAEGLREYLSPTAVSPAEHEARLRRFEGQLIAALDTAAPLAKVNPAVLSAVHDKDRISYTAQFSEIPLPEGSPAKTRMRALLERRGEWREEVAKSFVDTSGGFIDIFTHLNEAYQPVVFDSLMRPIADDWGQKSKTVSGRRKFWDWRRARPITEFIPLARSGRDSAIEEMVKGWFVALALGQLRLQADKAEIYLPETATRHGEWASFPAPMLSQEELDGPQGIAVTLVAIMIAMLEVNSKESIEPMAPYARLRELGQALGNFDTDVNSELKQWILDGRNACPDVAPDAGTSATRHEEVLGYFNWILQNYEEFFARTARNFKAPNGYPRVWDLRHEIIAGLHQLIRGVNAINTNPVVPGKRSDIKF